MILFVTGVGSLIHLYSIGYMHGDPRFSRFFAYLNLFAASMLVLVLGSSFLLTFLGWEGVGPVLLPADLVLVRAQLGGGRGQEGVRHQPRRRLRLHDRDVPDLLEGGHARLLRDRARPRRTCSQSTVTAIALLLFVGAMGKSAQVPLHIWLPDAMEGPTPVSALIHAATMVTAGVFLMVRAHVFFDVSEHAGTVVAWVGAITALFAATVAIVQNDIKRVLAYSTISQLGYMFLAVGVGAYSAAIFHMVMHAFFKALLFLGAGSVIHGMRRRAGHAAHGRPAQVHADHRGHVHRRLARDRGRRSRSPGSGRRTRSSPRRGSTTTTRSGRSGSSPRWSPRST